MLKRITKITLIALYLTALIVLWYIALSQLLNALNNA